jgi:Arc/MetJ family transcription regulator
MDMEPAKLAAAQQALGTKSETETVDRALEITIGRRRLSELIDRFAARGGLRAYDAQA